jgi:hypothetical protein
MSAVKKNPLAFIVFVLFIVFLPLLTVFLSRAGLQKNKVYKSDMSLLKDSILVDYNELNEATTNKVVLVAQINKDCSAQTLQALKSINNRFVKKDRKKIKFILQTNLEIQDSTWSSKAQYEAWEIDSAQWFINPSIKAQSFKLLDDNQLCNRVALVNSVGQLCEHYVLGDTAEHERLVKHMVLVLPKKERKKIEYKADKKLY